MGSKYGAQGTQTAAMNKIDRLEAGAMDAKLKVLVTTALDNLRQGVSICQDGQQECEVLPTRYNTSNLLLLVTLDGQRFVAKIAHLHGHFGERLKQEINWYKRISSQDRNILRHCPKFIGSFCFHENLILILEYIPDSLTIRDALMSGQLLPRDAIELIKRILTLFELRIGSYSELEERLLFRSIHKRSEARTQLLRKVLTSNPATADYWDRPISVNGCPSVSLAGIRGWLEQVTPQLIHPKVGIIGKSHGDLHLENILLQGDEHFYLIDPNAGVGPIPVYDLGKLAHSIYGLYDLIHSRNMSLSCPGPSEMHLTFMSEPYSLYQELAWRFTLLLRRMAENEGSLLDLYTQVRLMCLVHFLCLLPHHYQDNYIFFALMARTIELFHETKAELARVVR